MSCTEHIQGFSEIPNDWMFHHDTPSPWSSKMSDINLVTLLWKYENILQLSFKFLKLCVINQHLRKMLWGFKSKYDFSVTKQDFDFYMSSYEDTGTKSMLLRILGDITNE